jgi:hypothetical protein
MLVGSGAEKNDLPVFGKARKPGLELLEGERALKLHIAASSLIGIGAHQEGLAGFDPGIDLLRGDAYRGGHDAPPSYLKLWVRFLLSTDIIQNMPDLCA